MQINCQAQEKESVGRKMKIGAIAATIDTLATGNPLAVIRMASQAGNPMPKLNFGLWKGAGFNLAGSVSNMAIQYGLYEYLCSKKAICVSEQCYKLTPKEKLIAGATAGLTTGFLLAPLDVAFVQANQTHNKDKSIPAVLNLIVKEHGVKSLYRGLIPTIALYGAFGAAFQAGFPMLKQKLKDEMIPAHLQLSSRQKEFVSSIGASVMIGALLAPPTNPLDVVKYRVQSDLIKRNYSNSWQALNSGGLMRGLKWRLLRVPLSVITINTVKEVAEYLDK